MRAFIQSVGHYAVGLAGMGEMGALVATGRVSATVGVPIITGIITALVGVGAASSGKSSTPGA